jgi:hypothetical protein
VAASNFLRLRAFYKGNTLLVKIIFAIENFFMDNVDPRKEGNEIMMMMMMRVMMIILAILSYSLYSSSFLLSLPKPLKPPTKIKEANTRYEDELSRA